MTDEELVTLAKNAQRDLLVYQLTNKALREHVAKLTDGIISMLAAARADVDAETARLTECLRKANANHEEFERKWYLEQDAKDAAYDERNQCVAAMTRMATQLGWQVGLGRHEETDTAWDREWMNIVFIDTPKGQVSWHIHDDDLAMFAWMPRYPRAWDGHTTPEKYARLLQLDHRSGPTLVELCGAHVRQVMEATGGNKSRAAKILGIDRRSLYRWLEGGPSIGKPRAKRRKAAA